MTSADSSVGAEALIRLSVMRLASYLLVIGCAGVDARQAWHDDVASQEANNVGRLQSHPHRRNLDPLRRLAHRRGLLPARDLRLGARLLWPERLCRRTASAARLAGLADLVRHDVLLSVRRGAGRLRQRGDQGVRSAQLPDRGHLRDGRGRVSIGQVREPWQLYLANAVLAFGWAGTSLGIITNTLGLWFDSKRGMAISLALNGASFGGIVGVPLLVAAIGYFGFSGAMIASAVVMVVLMVPVILIFVGRPPIHFGAGARRGRGRAVADADPRAGVSRPRLPLGVDRVRAGAVRAGRLHRSPDLVSGFGDRARARGDRGGADDGDGGGRPRAVLLRDRPAQPAAGVGALVRQPGGGAARRHQRRTTTSR